MEKFVKLYEYSAIGQILVMKTTNEEGKPALRVVINADGAEVAAGPTYKDTDDGWDALDAAFNDVDEKWAVEYAQTLLQMLGGE